MDEQRVADYFVVAGLGEQPEPLEEVSNEAAIKPSFKQDPITDIVVINRSAGEKCPPNFQCLETTPSGFPANLNHGAIRCPDLYICYKRGREKPPLKDIGILYEGKERVMEGCEVVHTTPFGRPANINNSNSSRIYVTFRRADKNAATDTLVVVDLCIILTNKGEEPPLTYNQILKNLNKGMVGSDVFLCYKKAMVKSDVLVYKPTILGRYPEENYDNFPLPESVPLFCLPMGATIECWDAKAIHPLPGFSTFILTLSGAEKVYGAAVTFYEEHHESLLTDSQMRVLGLKNRTIREQYNIQKTVHVRKAICLLSHWPFFDAFKKFLSQLYKISITGPHHVPIERHISHFMYDVPYPSPQRPRILVQLAHDSLSLCMPEDSPLPQSGASFITLLRNLGPELCMNLMLYILLENKILLHSLRPTVLTEVAEAVTSIIFPFHWQCPYIPLCPLGLSAVLNAPCPFIVGIDSRYFDLYDPPPDVICVDLDTNRIWLPEDKKQLNYKTMPKKAVRILQESLHRLFEMSMPVNLGPANEEVSLEMTSVDLDFRRKKKQMQMELLIQEAFLRFMAILLRDYKSYLNPIMKQPSNRATDASFLFDMQGFLKSRDKTNTKFYTQMMKTQMFFRFIEERSFVSDKDASLAFFDECAEKMQIDDTNHEIKLIEIDESKASERTVFVMPPEPTGLPEGSVYHYNGFPQLKPELFLKKKISTLDVPKQPVCPHSPLSRRSKQEIKSSQKMAHQYLGNAKLWAKCLVIHCYSLWFISFPAYVSTQPKKLDALKVGLAVLQKMHAAKLPFIDQVCYRVLMQLAGQYNKPGLAVQVFSIMKKSGIQPNAITYGNYNRVMLEAKWTSPMSKGKQRWTRIRNVIIGIAKFRRTIRRRSVSLYSNSGSEFDQISHASMDSYLDDHGDKASVDTGVVLHNKVVFSPDTVGGEEVPSEGVIKTDEGVGGGNNVLSSSVTALDDRISTGGVSDGGYNSMTQEDVRRMSQVLGGVGEGDSLVSSSPSPTASDPDAATEPTQVKTVKPESWNPLRFSFKKKRHHSEKQKTENGVDNGHRPRVASIVRKSISSVSDHDSQQILEGTLLGNSAGLLMVSQSFLEHGAYLASGDLRQEVEQAFRRRRPDSNYHGPKPSRSMSLFASWRPRHLMNGDSAKISPASAVPVRFSDLAKKEEDDVSLSSLQSGDEGLTISQQRIAVNLLDTDSSSELKSDVKDSGVGLDEPSHSDIVMDVTETSESGAGDSVIVSHVPGHFSLEMDSGRMSVSESHSSRQLQGDALKSEQPCDSLILCNIDSSATSLKSDTPDSPGIDEGGDAADGMVHFQKNIQIAEKVPEVISKMVQEDQKEMRRGGSVTPPPRLQHPTSLGEMGRRMSTPAAQPLSSTLNTAVKSSNDGRTPVKKQQSLPTPQYPAPGSEPRKSFQMAESVLSRSQSFKRGGEEVMAKTNEALTGFWKLATKAASASIKVASASYTKFTELKDSITTPIKNAASLSSLTRSQDDLDAAESDRSSLAGSGAGLVEEDRTSVSSRDRLRQQQYSSHEQLAIAEESADDAQQASFGINSLGSAPSPSYLDNFRPPREVRSDSACGVNIEAAMEVEMSSCSRCSRCHRLVFDEEIMAGWSADDSNLNITCTFCHAKFVPNLQVYVKDWRGHQKSLRLSSDLNPGGADPVPNTTPPPPDHDPVVPLPQVEEETETDDKESGEVVSPMHLDSYPLSLQEAESAVRRRCTSECLTDAVSSHRGYYNQYPLGLSVPRSPLLLSIQDDFDLPAQSSSSSEIKKDFMTRSNCTAEPLVFPYLSPLVLRKELEYVLEHEGEMCLGTQDFLDQHPIIFWNLVWYFRRLEVPSHLPTLLLSAASFNTSGSVGKGNFDSRNILITPLWDNVRIHDEMGLPMYMAWSAGHKSTVVDALVTEQESFSRPVMYQIISSIQRNDVLTAIKLVVDNRRRFLGRKRRFRSLYREILFLSFVACGRENIDHDAFDREFGLAFEEKLAPAEIRRMQDDDKPRSLNVQWCRRVFCELEI